LVYGRTKAEEPTHFIKGATKTRCCFDVPEASHRVIALFDATVILFHSVIQVRIAAVGNPATECLAYGSWVGVMPIRCHPFWLLVAKSKTLP
jgi:hypothetical protein